MDTNMWPSVKKKWQHKMYGTFFVILLQIMMCNKIVSNAENQKIQTNDVAMMNMAPIDGAEQQWPNNWQDCPLLECANTIADNMHDENINEHFKGDINSHILLICFPSIVDSPIVTAITGSRQTHRLFTPISEYEEMCEMNCKNCTKNGIKWHGVELRWAYGKIEIRSSLMNGYWVDLTSYVRQKFGGSLREFLKALMIPENCKNEVPETNEEQNDDMAGGAFLEDLIGVNADNMAQENNNYYLRTLHSQLSSSFNFIDKNPNMLKNGLTIYTAMKPVNDTSWKKLKNETKLKICREEVEQNNREADYDLYTMDEWYCLLSDEERANLTGKIDVPPPNGATQEWGGDANGPLKAPPPLTFEEEKERMNSVVETVDPSVVDPAYRGGSSPKNRTKRQNSAVVCEKHQFDIRNKWPKCREIISSIRNQGGCSSCWAVAAASALTDRSCIFVSKKRPWANFTVDPKRFVSARDTMECTYGHNKECNGGSADKAWKYYNEKGTVNEYCKPYVFNSPRSDWKTTCHFGCDVATKDGGSLDLLAWGNSLDRVNFGGKDEVNENTWIANKQHSGLLYSTIDYFRLYRSDENMERLMIEQLETNGTINAGIYAAFKFATVNKDAIFKDCPKGHALTHDVRIIGYGYIQCKNGEQEFAPDKFWLVANSWGPEWNNGQRDGTILMQRGSNACSIESDVCWGSLDMFPFRKDAGTSNVKS